MENYNSAISSVASLLKPKQTSSKANMVSYLTSLISELLFNGSLCIFHANKRECQESNKNIFPNRDVVLFFFWY